MKILLAEDSGFMRVALERVLVKVGHQVSTVSDGEQAVRMIAAKLPDLVLLDMMLPKLSGPEVLAQLKRDPSTQHIPVVVLTSLSQKNEAKLLEAGAAAYVVKSDKLLENDSESLLRLVAALGPKAQAAGAGE
jgi:twitching motility two-component system response regulator PilH